MFTFFWLYISNDENSKIDYHGINPGFSLSLVTTELLDINNKHKMHNILNQFFR